MRCIPIILALFASGVCAVEAPPPAKAPGAIIEEVDFRELHLTDAVRVLAQQTGLNLVTSAEAGKVLVTIYLRNVTARAAIEALCKSHDLWFKEDESGIIRIMKTEEFQRDLVNFREEKTEIFTLLYPNAVSVALAIRDLFGDRVQLSFGQRDTSDEQTDLQSRFDRFDVIDQRSQGLGLFSAGGTTTTGGGGGNFSSSSTFNGAGSNRFSSSSDFGGVATRRQDLNRQRDLPDEFRNLTAEQAQAVQRLIDAGASKESAAALEAYRKQTANIFVTLSRRNNLVAIRTSDQSALEEIRAIIKRLDVQTPTVLLEVKVLSVELSDGLNSIFDYQFSDGVNNAGGFSSGDIQPPAADALTGTARKAAGLAVGGSAVQGGDLIYQFVNKNFRARIQLLESKNKVTTLATPLIMTANNEVSRLFIGEERPIVRNISSQTVVNNNTVTSTPNTTIEFRPVGTTLLITPNINSDRTVTLRLLQENSSINAGAANIPVVTNNGNVTQQPVDVVATKTVSGTVVAKDDLELAVGGLIQDAVQDNRAQVPGLGKIPGFGFFFRRQQSGRSKSELIIVIRPHIISTPYESEAISQCLIGELSMHPKAPDVRGTLPTFTPREVLLPNPPEKKNDRLKRYNNLKQDEE